MLTVGIVFSTLVAVAAGGLAFYGRRSVAGEFDDVIEGVRRVVETVSATARRGSESEGQLTIVLEPARGAEIEQNARVVVVEAPDAEITPSAQVVAPSHGPSEVHFSVKPAKSGSADVAIAIYDLKTLTPLASLKAEVPAAGGATLVTRLLSVIAR